MPQDLGLSNTRDIIPVPLEQISYNWVSYSFIFILIVFAFVNVIHPSRFKQIVNSFSNKTFANLLMRESSFFKERVSLALFAIYLPAVALLVYFIGKDYFEIESFRTNGLYTYGLIISAVLLYWIYKILFIHTTGSIFKTQVQSYELRFSFLIYNLMAGVILFPVLILYFYSGINFFLLLATILIFLVYIYRIIRAFQIGIAIVNFSILYLFLYLCTLEILPLAFIAKLLMNYLASIT